jgi:hypothetical protein
MNKNRKKIIKKKYIKYQNARRTMKKNRIKKKVFSKKLYRKNKNNYKSRQRNRRIMKNRSHNMSGGGIPFGGTIKGMLGLTHGDEVSRENMLGNLCALNSVRPTTDTQLSGILNQVCTLNDNVSKKKKDSGIVKGVMRLIGNIATLPLRTASGVVKNVTGFDASDAAYNAIKNSVSREEDKQNVSSILPQQSLIGGQPLPIKHTNQQPIIQTGQQMHGGEQHNDINILTNIKKKLTSGGSLTNDEISYISKLN